MAVKMNLRILTKNLAADPEIGFLKKSISKSNGSATAMPTAWELILKIYFGLCVVRISGYLRYVQLDDAVGDLLSRLSFVLRD